MFKLETERAAEVSVYTRTVLGVHWHGAAILAAVKSLMGQAMKYQAAAIKPP